MVSIDRQTRIQRWVKNGRFSRTIPLIILLISILVIGQGAHVSRVYAAVNVIEGTAFRDYNANGSKDGSLEPGIEGVIVNIMDADGDTDSTTTDDAGYYTITADGTNNLNGEVRVEFTLPVSLDFLQPGAAGGSTVQFADIDSGGSLNVGFNNPAQYSQPNPQLFTPIYIQQDNINGPNNASYVSGAVAYTASGAAPTIARQVPAAEMGATYGVAWQIESAQLFTSSYIKNAVGLGPNAAGTGTTTGGIYLVTDTGATASAALFMDLEATLGLGADPHPASTDSCASSVTGNTDNEGCWYHDGGAFATIGKMGLGDLDFNSDQTLLYTVDLTNRELVEIPVGNPAIAPVPGAIVTYAIPTDACAAAADARPFALAPYDDDADKMYVGVTCTGQTNNAPAEMSAVVYEFDRSGVGSFSKIYQHSLNYPRLRPIGSWGACNTAGTCAATWRPWEDDINQMNIVLESGDANAKKIAAHPQPMLTDIAFDGPDLILAVRDRVSDMFGSALGNPTDSGDARTYDSWAGGDLLRVCDNGAGIWTMESNGTCGGVTGGGAGNTDGYGGGEYYFDFLQAAGGYHPELFVGGMVQLPGFSTVAVTLYDGSGTVNTGDIGTWTNGTGIQSTGARLYGDTSPHFGKANGLGDLEALRDPAPIEIGNRVWEDTDGDGVQDPDEDPLVGVTLNLYRHDGGTSYTLVGTTPTIAGGHYAFTDSNVNQNGATGVEPNTTYVIRIDNTDPIVITAGLSNLSPKNQGGKDTIDTDGSMTNIVGAGATIPGRAPEIVVTTDGNGHNNHTYDFGFNGDPDNPTAVSLQAVQATTTASVIPVVALAMLALAATAVFLRRRTN